MNRIVIALAVLVVLIAAFALDAETASAGISWCRGC
jgi:hypothetical protein